MANITVRICKGANTNQHATGTFADTDATGTKAFINGYTSKTDDQYRAYIVEGHGGLTRLTYDGLTYHPDLPPPPY